MSKDFKRFTVTAALPYANGPIHIGQLAGAYIGPDIYTRYLRSQGKDVVFVCGSDEHGAAILLKSIRENTSPQSIIDHFHGLNKKSFERFGINFDIFHRTSESLHHQTSSDFFTKLYEENVFDEKESEQYFDVEHNQFLADRYIIGTCPNCKSNRAYGDQCESCGTTLSPTELIDPKSTLSGSKPILKSTKHLYLPLDKHESWLKDWHTNEKAYWKNNVHGQCLSWIDQGLLPRAMTRDLNWGVRVPLKGFEGKVLYVWLDAPIGYISATKQWAKDNGKNWEDYWKSDDTALVHFIGKDNIVFHCIIFPLILKLHGDYILPENVPANEFMNMEGDKISTSRNWAVWLHEYLDEFPGKEDVLRYVLTANMPESKDSEFTWKDFQQRNNSELVAILGNFVNRALVLTEKYYDGVVPEGILDTSTIDLATKALENSGRSIQEYRFREAQTYMMEIARIGNKYLADLEPWKLIKTDPESVKSIMLTALKVVEILLEGMQPFLPFTAEKLEKIIGVEGLNSGVKLNKAELLFEKVEDEIIAEQIQKLESKRIVVEEPKEEMKKEISFDQFMSQDIRVGEIKEAEKVEGTDKLIKFKVDLGFETRTIISGIALSYAPEEMIGKKVVVLINLKPRKIRGIESQGMILMSGEGDDELVLISPEKSVPNGTIIG